MAIRRGGIGLEDLLQGKVVTLNYYKPRMGSGFTVNAKESHCCNGFSQRTGRAGIA